MTPKEIFLSHSSEDHEFATSVANTIRQYGIPVWYAPTNMVGAQEWQDEIGLALRRCDWFAVILSPNSVESMWVKRELQYALHQRRFEKRIVPVLYLPCDLEILSWTLPSLQRLISLNRLIMAGPRYFESGESVIKKPHNSSSLSSLLLRR